MIFVCLLRPGHSLCAPNLGGYRIRRNRSHSRDLKSSNVDQDQQSSSSQHEKRQQYQQESLIRPIFCRAHYFPPCSQRKTEQYEVQSWLTNRPFGSASESNSTLNVNFATISHRQISTLLAADPSEHSRERAVLSGCQSHAVYLGVH